MKRNNKAQKAHSLSWERTNSKNTNFRKTNSEKMISEKTDSKKTKSRQRRTIPLVLCAFLAAASILLSGCGNRIVFTAGFGGDEVFEVGGEPCSTGALKVYILEAQRQTETVFGDDVWKKDSGGQITEVVREKALSRISRIMALSQMAVKDNIMLTSTEEEILKQAASEYISARTEQELEYLGVDENDMVGLYRDYVLAVREYQSRGVNFEEDFNENSSRISSQLNTSLWNTVATEDLSGQSTLSTGFEAIYREYFEPTQPADAAD